ncbi:hypothetical protein LCGC14_1509630 [marine sediment metagenome]|uniref:Uncharacterized protein n=1 Tax=marine sediment metagenome TaxID=412755 RepID=A0A0F9J209_9ZZZZ
MNDTEEQLRACWRFDTDGKHFEARGELEPAAEARAFVEDMNEAFGKGTHWIEEAKP